MVSSSSPQDHRQATLDGFVVLGRKNRASKEKARIVDISDFDFSTLGVRGGQVRSPEGEHNDPIHMTSSFVFESAEQAARLAVLTVAALLLTPTAHGTHLGERAVLTAELQPRAGGYEDLYGRRDSSTIHLPPESGAVLLFANKQR